MFILGNAEQLGSRSKMWKTVIQELQEADCCGPALPIACHQHPRDIKLIKDPGQLPRYAPDGGCLLQCNARLKCGHMCPYKCHPDDRAHVSVRCLEKCTRLCSRQHPCQKDCAQDCGKCTFPVRKIMLSCGHIAPSVPCHQLDDLKSVFCASRVEKRLPQCEHSAMMPCSADPSTHSCLAVCNLTMSCCGRACSAACHRCQEASPHSTPHQRTKHSAHPCKALLFCSHQCANSCSDDHQHTSRCQKQCRQECVHATCKYPCSKPCAPCQEACPWTCPHHSCHVPCGSVSILHRFLSTNC
jgi:hypothetical protein